MFRTIFSQWGQIEYSAGVTCYTPNHILTVSGLDAPSFSLISFDRLGTLEINMSRVQKRKRNSLI